MAASRSSPQFWLLVAFLVLVFFTGGSARVDVASLVILRPVSVVICAIALLTLRKAHFADRMFLLWGFVALSALILSHLIPLPPSLWHNLPGREIFAQIDKEVGLGEIWRPLTITPMNGWHALLSLSTPLAVLLLAVQLKRDDLFRMLYIVIALGAVSALLGALQIAGSPNGPLYFYRITNNGAAVGLFANRNHSAALLATLFPMLATFASISAGTADEQRLRQMLAAGFAIILIPLIIITGSRTGLGLGLLGIGSAALLYRKPTPGREVRRGGRQWKLPPLPILGGLAVLSLVLLTVFFARGQVFGRLFKKSSFEEGRGDFWVASLDLIRDYFPFGSGVGSFVEAYQIIEPDKLLDASYLNHAHNDWIEIVATTGLPGLALLVAALYFGIKRTISLWKIGDEASHSVKMAKMAAVILAFLALASITDYPLRTASMMSVATLAMLWFVEWWRPTSDGGQTPIRVGES